MASTVREILIQEIFTKLQGITVEAGYRTDIGLNGYRWKSTEWQEEQLPGFDLRDTRSRYAPRVMHSQDWDVDIEITVAMLPTSNISDQLITAESDVFKSLNAIRTFGGFKINDVQVHAQIDPVDNVFQARQADRICAAATLRYNLHFRHQLWDPFTP